MTKVIKTNMKLIPELPEEASLASSNDFDDDPTTTITQSDEGNGPPKVLLARRENKAVFRLRLLVFLVLFLAAAAVCVIVYLVTFRGEQDEYKAQYESAANKLLETFHDIANTKLAAVSSLGVASVASDAQPWPFVSFENFHQRGATARKQSGSIWITVHPMVTDADRAEWETYVVSNASQWIADGVQYQENMDMFAFAEDSIRGVLGGALNREYGGNDTMPIYMWGGRTGITPVPSCQFGCLPVWSMTPVIFGGITVNQDENANPYRELGANVSYNTRSVTLGRFQMDSPGNITANSHGTAMFALLQSVASGEMEDYLGDPITQAFFPIFDSFTDNRKPVAVMTAWLHFKSYFENILPSRMNGVMLVLHNSCSGAFTYEINGPRVAPLGQGDLHDGDYDSLKRSASFAAVESIEDGTKYGIPLNNDHCLISLDVYPSSVFKESYQSSTPSVLTLAVAGIFVFTMIMFVIYDRLVERRQALNYQKLQKTSAIVTSMFPPNVQARLMEQASDQNNNQKHGFNIAPTRRLKGYLDGQAEDDIDQTPIADLFPHCTVLFTDIAGFTAWSSTRDPAQIFVLLQTVYQAFDRIAKRRKVFKVETIGDSYVAVTGLPEPQAAHAVIITRFAAECRDKLNELMPRLERRLGPGTAELSMRFGLHSGPVTAGVLRGERARFQLFGDTVNTAARMESTGKKDMIQVSKTTRDLLVAAGKSNWITARADSVHAKGQGVLEAYWVNPTDSSSMHGSGNVEMSNSSSDHTSGPSILLPSSSAHARKTQVKHERLVAWIVEVLQDHLKKLVASRGEAAASSSSLRFNRKDGQNPLDEVAEAIVLPRFSDTTGSNGMDFRQVDLGEKVLSQLHAYVTAISRLYHSNPFHNFEHACHVTMSTEKFLLRIVDRSEGGETASEIHEYTHGINSDRLTLLAIVFSALVHDADHRGVSNGRLAEEDHELFMRYGLSSIAEQNSLDLAWNLLVMGNFQDLRQCMFTTKEEMKRFRQVLVNVVLATDIFDVELNNQRKSRWEKAFSNEYRYLPQVECNDLRATIVIEHIIQASDVSHTMQHWHVYRKWNRLLFRELSLAYRQGRMGKDPSEFWYQGEIGFFDNYIIPLAKKLAHCQVFGVSSEECLNFAVQNREEWKEKGQQIVAEMVAELESEVTQEGTDSEQNDFFEEVEC